MAISVPIGAVVGFGLQLRQLKEARLRTKVLELQIKELDAKVKQLDSMVLRASLEEIKKYGSNHRHNDIRFSISEEDTASSATAVNTTSILLMLKQAIQKALFPGVLLSIALYLIYDLYRVAFWLVRSFGWIS
ncbi:hypothetical protein M5C96_24390 [Acidovorax sp. GBBC 1281]|uniref:hypothetical protein n=1 Tax=unclassified Acidovorax TaxID=2684926 RepID=UPI00234960A5|nr:MULTISPECIES: hypothetical protein [unclassified Acidovorax]WCM97488.1 hypothetical protein M5C96_24390 [Acidovorax sp. GBBC 1281]